MAAREESDLFMSVRLEHVGRICNVLVTSQTTGQDVIECLKPDDDKTYYLVEIWKGCERPISHEEKLKNVLVQWGSDLDDVSFMLKEKLSRKNHSQKKHRSPHNSPVPFQDHLHEQEMKVESMEKELKEKERYLHSLRAKDAAKNGLKSNYVRRLELKVLEQEEQLKRLQTIEKEIFKYQVENEKLVLELQRVRSMFAFKHQQLAEASARIELLTRELSVKRREKMLDKDLAMPLVQDGLDTQEKTKCIENDVQQYPYTYDKTNNQQDENQQPVIPVHQPVKPVYQRVSNHQAVPSHQAPLTEKEILRLTDSMIHNRQRVDPKKHTSGKNGGFLSKHAQLVENDDENSLLSWRDEEENDTETSADSGHVSVDSPSYQTMGMGPSFYFNGNPPGLYTRNVERFDIDKEFASQIEKRNTEMDLKERDMPQKITNPTYSQHSLPRTKQRKTSLEADYKKSLFIQTEKERTSMNLSDVKTQSKLDSPQSTSSLSSQSSQLSEVRGGAMSSSNQDRTISRPSKDPRNETLGIKGTRSKPETKSNPDRSAGSISHFQRRHSDCESPTLKDPSSPQPNDNRVKTPVPDNTSAQRPPVVKRTDSNSPVPNQRLVSRENAPKPGVDSKPEKRSIPVGQPVPSVGVQDILNEIPALKVSGRDTKAFQIQTIAEKDSAETSSKTRLIEKPENKGGQPAGKDAKTPERANTSRKLAPKPLPRKRTKTPPVRNTDATGNLVMTLVTTTSRPLTPTTEDSTIIPENPRHQGKENNPVSEKVGNGGGQQSTGTNKKGAVKPGTSVGESNLRGNSGKNKKSGKRVSLDPHAVLLHASLDGELDVVKSIIYQVEDPSFPNTEGLTALHHAVCNNHDDIVKFLVEYGCDINAADMQGWTSLHCAAANNRADVCKYLVRHGACVFSVTAIEGKTPSLCCEKDSENFHECFLYLSDLENNVGIMNDGVVYSVYAYQATRKDELSFECGERMTVVRRGDVTEKEWWWARDSRGQFGYIPRNLLGLSPRIAPDV